ncbi:pectate lyase superfamily protein-domain-containing protein [Leptodontidium sp. 2 PMI_412]|nr:pectate lyase superfamily protein-domain-containing protein [Leptodontidium sp. 2 PMI_412]
MNNICANANSFAALPRGAILHPGSSVPNNKYGFDFNQVRKDRRRTNMCPGSWKNRPANTCPATGSANPFRSAYIWFTSALEPGTTVNQIANRRDPATNQVTINSGIRYTCDEFPPASWVEGGAGATLASPGTTRCAAARCAPSINAEQDWQGFSHRNLRLALQRVAEDHDELGDFDDTNSVAFFRFNTYNLQDGTAAKVVTTNPPLLPSNRITIASRDEGAANVTEPVPLRFDIDNMTMAEINALVAAGLAREDVVPANVTLFESQESSRKGEFNGTMQSLWGEDTFHAGSTSSFDAVDNDVVVENKRIRVRISNDRITPLIKRASPLDLESARLVVESALNQSFKLNQARLAKPLRNIYGLRPGTTVGQSTAPSTNINITINNDVSPLLTITPEIVQAAALVAEADAVANPANVNSNMTKRAVSGSYWMEHLARKGTVPWGDDPNYRVFRNVVDYGAVGDGVTDDTKAITSAMNNGTRCGKGCNGSTTKNAIVYFPPGKYLISSTIAMPFGTQVIGDAINRPTLLASPKFVGLGVLSTDEYTGGGTGTDGLDQEYFVNTANFYRQIRNVVIDITNIQTPPATGADLGQSCIHYQVAQATSLENVELIASAALKQVGLYAENGSGGQISDVTFTGGAVGIYGGNQQFTAQRLTFNGCSTGVHLIWDWGWVWKSVTMNNVGVGFQLTADKGTTGNIGSAAILDSTFTNVGTVVIIAPPSSTTGSGSTGLTLERVKLSGVTTAVADNTGAVILAGSSTTVDEWALGPVYEGSTTARSYSKGGKVGSYKVHQSLLDANGHYFERAKPQYESLSVGSFYSVKDAGAAGDGSTDDTAAFQAALYLTAAKGQVLFVDAGSYILTSTVTIPPGARIVGETWSQLVASGAYFSDATKPQVLLKVGNAGDVGSVEMQDLLFTTRGATAGLILVEWNIAADAPGSAGLWDCHARIGGATGTHLTPAECPAVTSGVDSGCSAASLMMHLTSTGSGYFENMWLWGADHMIDDPDMTDANNTMVQTTIYVARGFLIESTKPTWLYATASEHSVFYQYNFNGAANIFAGLLQTESPYFQPSPPPPAPFTNVVGTFAGDPKYTCSAGDEFSGCDESWSVIMTKSENIFVASAGLYSWFSSYAQTCIDTQQCQKTLIRLDSNYANVRFQNLITIGAKYMAVMDGKGIAALDNLNVKTHPDWSQITLLDVGSNGTQFGEVSWIDPSLWEMDQPEFACSIPCTVRLPVWPSATTTVNYPLMTVSNGAWTSTITQAPLTYSQWFFELVTITADGSNGKVKRQTAGEFWPVLATTTKWPAVQYTGIDGSVSATAPPGPFPTPPVALGPNSPDPIHGGHWPKLAVRYHFDPYDSPLIDPCIEYNIGCMTEPWVTTDPPYTSQGQPNQDPNDDDGSDEPYEACPFYAIIGPRTDTSTVATSTSTTAPTPTATKIGNPMTNTVSCYNSGENTEGIRMQNAAKSFCNQMQYDDFKENYMHQSDQPFDYNGGIGTVTIHLSLEIKAGCTWVWDLNECLKYLSVPTDSCNCNGVNGKQGGVVTNDCYTWRIDPNISL